MLVNEKRMIIESKTHIYFVNSAVRVQIVRGLKHKMTRKDFLRGSLARAYASKRVLVVFVFILGNNLHGIKNTFGF